MTIANPISRADRVGNGVNDTFIFEWEIYVKTDNLVYVAGELQAVDVNYTVPAAGIENPDGGTIVFGAEYIPALDAVVSIILNLPYTQKIDYEEGGKFPAETHERGLDRLVKIAQQLKERILRQPTLLDSSQYSDLSLPDPVASKLLAWKDDLTGLKNVEIESEGDLAVTDFIKTLLDDEDATAARVTVLEGYEVYPEKWGRNTVPGTTDMTVAVHAAFTAAKAIGGKVVFGPEIYRVTSGFDQDTNYHDLTMEGMGASREDNDQATIILLDNANADSYFYKAGARHNLVVRNIVFKCNQEVQDRKFFRFTASPVHFIYDNINFESVEKPIVFEAGCYFQNSSLHDVQFRGSGTIHSETSDLIGTLLLLNNVNHEGAVPANTDKIVCDLSGIRQIQGINFLLEGVCPAANWTVLKLEENVHDAEFTRFPIASFHGFWSEWIAPVPIYVVDQVSGRTLFSSNNMNLISSTSQFKLSSSAQVTIEHQSFAGALNNFVDLFDIENFKCHVILRECALRDSGSLTTLGEYYDDRFTIINSNLTRSGVAGDEILSSTVFSNTQSSLIYKWDGGYLDGESAVLTMVGGTTYQLDTDATYGRQLTIIPNVNVVQAQIEVKLRGTLAQYKQVIIVATFKLPTYTSGDILFRALEDGVAVGSLCTYDAMTYSAQTVTTFTPFRPKTALASDLGFEFYDSSAGEVANNLELYAFAIYAGNAAPRVEYPSYPKNIITWAAAAPAAGSFAKGDIVWNNAPAAGGDPGWVCTGAGSPGTWNAMANLDA